MVPVRPAEPDLVRAARQGDAAAWRAVVGAHGPRVWGLCRRLAAEPEDAYQEIWEKVHRSLSRYDATRGALAPWVIAIAHRHLVDRHRRRSVRGEVLPLPELADPAPSVVDALHGHARAAALEAAIAQLPADQRRVVVLHHLHDRAVDEIAATEGVAVGTVKSRLHRGRARLVQLLGEGR